MRTLLLLLCFVVAAPAAPRGKVAGGLERLLYVTDRIGLSVYDINDGHALLGRIDVPDTGNYKGIAASPALGQLYLSSYRTDELVAMDLATNRVVWRKKHGKYADSMFITPDGRTMYVPYRDEDWWGVVDAATGDLRAKIHVGRGKNYDDHPIGSIGPHNTWINPAG
ncbi:MAG: YncE family protein, partial [Bryobacteraceae bacterium]